MSKPLLACLALLLAGCSNSAPETKPYAGPLDAFQRVAGLNPAYPGPSPTGAFDGSYFGYADQVRSQSPSCPHARTGAAEIGDKRLSFAYQPQMNFNPPVKPDGTLHDTIGPAVLDGRVAGDRLVMTVTTPDCETHYALHYLYNHS